jgi:uncharacterized protein HemX
MNEGNTTHSLLVKIVAAATVACVLLGVVAAVTGPRGLILSLLTTFFVLTLAFGVYRWHRLENERRYDQEEIMLLQEKLAQLTEREEQKQIKELAANGQVPSVTSPPRKRQLQRGPDE